MNFAAGGKTERHRALAIPKCGAFTLIELLIVEQDHHAVEADARKPTHVSRKYHGKALVCALLCFEFCCSILGQGYFRFSNFEPLSGINAPVFDSQGNRLGGSGYFAELYVGQSVNSLEPVLSDSTATLSIQPFRTSNGAGYIVPDTVSAANVAGGTIVWVQMRAWDAQLGATYDQAQLLGLGGYGESNPFQVRAGLVTGAGTEYAPLVGLQSFSLLPEVPEPNTVSLVLLSLSVLWFRCHRRNITLPGKV